jgi:hypothetical protein
LKSSSSFGTGGQSARQTGAAKHKNKKSKGSATLEKRREVIGLNTRNDRIGVATKY